MSHSLSATSVNGTFCARARRSRQNANLLLPEKRRRNARYRPAAIAWLKVMEWALPEVEVPRFAGSSPPNWPTCDHFAVSTKSLRQRVRFLITPVYRFAPAYTGSTIRTDWFTPGCTDSRLQDSHCYIKPLVGRRKVICYPFSGHLAASKISRPQYDKGCRHGEVSTHHFPFGNTGQPWFAPFCVANTFLKREFVKGWWNKFCQVGKQELSMEWTKHQTHVVKKHNKDINDTSRQDFSFKYSSWILDVFALAYRIKNKTC